jgi:hypothetical protein
MRAARPGFGAWLLHGRASLRVASQVENVLLRQPPPRPFAPAVVAQKESLAAMSEESIRATTSGYAKVQCLALLLRALRYPMGAAGVASDAKVLIVPPTNKDVRDEFISSLRATIGRDAMSDLNERGHGGKDRKLETATALTKFRTGRGSYWQCAQCGARRTGSTAEQTAPPRRERRRLRP